MNHQNKSSWAAEEFDDVSLGDKRLNARLIKMCDRFSDAPESPINQACLDWAETKAAYRFFQNDKVEVGKMLATHRCKTAQRAKEHKTVLALQDTSYFVYTNHPKTEGLGKMSLKKGRNVKNIYSNGLIVHTCLAITTKGLPLGLLDQKIFSRKLRKKNISKNKPHDYLPIEDKESYRWVETLRRTAEDAQHCPSTQVICLADSEADIYELLAEGTAQPPRVDWIVRACQNRALQRKNSSENDQEAYVREHVFAQPVLFTHTIQVRGRTAKVACETRGRRQPRESRETQVEIRAARVTLRPPWRADRKLPEATMNVVFVREADPPPKDEPVEWLLLTSLPIDKIEQVRTVIQYYCVRWMIEVFFRVLKSGCRVEERRFEHIDRLLSCLAVYLIVAWRTLYVCRLGRGCPELHCEAVFEPAEWKAVWKVVQRTDPPAAPPSLGEIVLLVAQLGGYVNRKRKDPPGPQTVWIGLQRMYDFALCWRLFGPGVRSEPLLV